MRIKIKLTLLMFLLVIISLSVPSIMAINSFAKELRLQVVDNLEDHGIHIMDEISRTIYERISDMNLMSGPESPLSGSKHSIDEKVELLRDMERTSKAYASISIYDINGIKIGDTRNVGIGWDESDKPFFKNAIKGEIYHDDKPVLSKSLDQYVMHFSGPLYDDYGNINGVVAARFPIGKIRNLLSGGRHSEKLMFDLLAEDMAVIYSNYRKTASHEDYESFFISEELNDSGYLSGNFASINTITDEEIFVAVRETGYLDYSGSNWTILIEDEAGDAFKEVDELSRNFLILAVAILAFSIFLTFSFAKSISKPVKELTRAIEDISIGKMDIEISRKLKESDDELGRLARAFDRTLVSLKLAMRKAGIKEFGEDEFGKATKITSRDMLDMGLIKNMDYKKIKKKKIKKSRGGRDE